MEGSSVPITDNTQAQLDDLEKAEVLANHFHANIGTAPTLDSPQDLHSTINNAINSPKVSEVAQPFTPPEVDRALNSLTPVKAAGNDLIPYEFLKHLTPTVQSNLLQVYNTSWQIEEFPSCGKQSVLIPIRKPGRDPKLPSAYRPVALLSCIGKLMNSLVVTRLSWWVEESRLLGGGQSGFRPHRSTLNVLAQVEFHICDTYNQRQVLSVLFVILEEAFDSAPHKGVAYKLTSMGITRTTLAWVKNFLSGLQIRITPHTKRSSIGLHHQPPAL